MRRLLAWLGGAAGGLAAYRALARRRAEPAAADGRAEELRARLAQARADDEPPAAEPEPLDPQARRARVHEEGRAALDEMRGGE